MTSNKTPPKLRADMAARATQAAEFLRILANQNRLMIVCTLVEGERSVGELEALLGIHQPTLSQQLAVLRDGGFVETRRDAKQIFYRLTEDRAARLVTVLYDIFCAEEDQP
ncbi:ArsR family transcriptional regulator [Pararhizobium antarcticum]|uniref:ArsR family transcriptional regulator n=2 Tax=Pararhizobium antarcticum TaxID=1798805 RepID=A0A657LNX4_9HYPH|nr:metalloregulator ArsR/SmtB family transcription factor [Pararhizobium antarcticum]OJF93512.1 ArsR family transcriptional regulator [Pararhizobium antarcticum]OJG00499.1 ArsR family transcriptional regulator [Rhizobium sp. 58]